MTRMMDKSDTVDATYPDFATAFHSVNHMYLLAQMKSFDLGEVIVRWIEAYFSGRLSRIPGG